MALTTIPVQVVATTACVAPTYPLGNWSQLSGQLLECPKTHMTEIVHNCFDDVSKAGNSSCLPVLVGTFIKVDLFSQTMISDSIEVVVFCYDRFSVQWVHSLEITGSWSLVMYINTTSNNINQFIRRCIVWRATYRWYRGCWSVR